MISIIVPCKNRIDKLQKCLDSININITYAKKKKIGRDYEIIVINDHSEKGFKEIVNKLYPNVKVIDSDGVGPGYARNLGIKSSMGKYLFFTDSDCIVSEDWIVKGYDKFISTNAMVIQGIPWLFQKNTNIYLGDQEERLYNIMFSTYINKNYTSMTDSRNLLINKDIINIMGEEVFSERSNNATAESRVFGNRCNDKGIKILFDNNVKIYHEDSDTMVDVCKQKYRHGSGRIEIWKEKPSYIHLKSRYFEIPINSGIDIDYVLPAHFSFLLGYYRNLNDKEEFSKFMDFIKQIFSSYNRSFDMYCELLELM